MHDMIRFIIKISSILSGLGCHELLIKGLSDVDLAVQSRHFLFVFGELVLVDPVDVLVDVL